MNVNRSSVAVQCHGLNLFSSCPNKTVVVNLHALPEILRLQTAINDHGDWLAARLAIARCHVV